MQVSCGECGQSLDEPSDTPVDQRQPCPNCGSKARSVAILLTANVSMVGGASATLTVVHAVDALVAQPAVREVIKTRELTVRVHEPHRDAPGYVVELLDENGQLLGAATADDATDACLAVAMEMEETLKKHDE